MKNRFDISDIEKRIAQRNQLAAVDIQGSFDFPTALIHLNALKKNDIELVRKVLGDFKPNLNNKLRNFLSAEQFSILAKVQPLAVHEYTHFIDSTSTLWGLRHLKKMSDAYESVSLNESNYYKAKFFSDHLQKIKLPKYYTVVDDSVHDDKPWRSVITIGRCFDKNGEISKNPILFSQFRSPGDEIIVRSPVSTISILEASAMAQEVMHHTSLLSLTNPEFKLVEQSDFSKKYIDFLYSRNLTEYSVCVHVLANKLGCKDVGVAFRICARITRLVLNFPLTLFEKLSEVCPVETLSSIPLNHDFAHAIRDGLRACDLGTLYYLLCIALPSNVVESEVNFSDGLVIALRSLGIDTEQFENERDSEAKQIIELVRHTPIKQIALLAEAGYENFKKIQLSKDALDFSELNVPPSMLGDESIVTLLGAEENSLANFDIIDCFFELDRGMDWVRRFSEACH